MCGIVAYCGDERCADILYEGLKHLEYRGYDSAGLAVHDGTTLTLLRAEGKLDRLRAALGETPLNGSLGIGHTRWATHGKPSEENAHPHRVGPVALVHNGIIENYLPLREELCAQGAVFQSETDSEILSHLIARGLARGEGFEAAVRRALGRVTGSFAVAVLCETEPDLLIVARRFSPLVLGIGRQRTYVASDVPALLAHTREVIFLEDGDFAVIRRDGITLTQLCGAPQTRPTRHIDWSLAMAEKGGYKHFMLKEIHEQPRALSDTLRGRVSLARGLVEFETPCLLPAFVGDITRVVIVACGTSWHAGLVGKAWIEELAGLPVDVEHASEFRTRPVPLGANTLVVAISQSGETADTLAAIGLARQRGARCLGICNVLESSLARLCTHTLYTHAGPEISVASTKAFTTQLAVLYLFAVGLGRQRQVLSERAAAHKLLELVRVPVLMEEWLAGAESLRAVAETLRHFEHYLFIGRWVDYPVALEGALKLKEISYSHAEGYPAGEMKHGPIALLDDKLVVVALALKNRVYEKMLSNIQEARARHAQVLAIGSAGDTALPGMVDQLITLPLLDEELSPLLSVLPMQLLAYYTADLRGSDVDQPRNLAKSVTVE